MHALQTKKWFQTLQKKIQLSFKKIRICKPKEDETSKLFQLRGNLRQKLKLSDEEDKDAIIEEIQETEDKLSILTAEENKNKVIKNFEALANTDGSCNINGIWKMKKKMFPKNKQAIPVAKKDMDGKILSSQEDIKKLYVETFTHRLRH